MDMTEIFLSLGVILAAIFLFFYWKSYHFLFSIVFGLAMVLMLILTIDMFIRSKRKIRVGAVVLYSISTIVLIGFFTLSILIAVNG